MRKICKVPILCFLLVLTLTLILSLTACSSDSIAGSWIDEYGFEYSFTKNDKGYVMNLLDEEYQLTPSGKTWSFNYSGPYTDRPRYLHISLQNIENGKLPIMLNTGSCNEILRLKKVTSTSQKPDTFEFIGEYLIGYPLACTRITIDSDYQLIIASGLTKYVQSLATHELIDSDTLVYHNVNVQLDGLRSGTLTITFVLQKDGFLYATQVRDSDNYTLEYTLMRRN